MSTNARMLKVAANQAHERGDIGEAAILYLTLLELFPSSKEAADATYYLANAKPRPSVAVANDRPSDDREPGSENLQPDGGDAPAW